MPVENRKKIKKQLVLGKGKTGVAPKQNRLFVRVVLLSVLFFGWEGSVVLCVDWRLDCQFQSYQRTERCQHLSQREKGADQTAD